MVQRLFAGVIHDAIWFMNIHEQNHPWFLTMCLYGLSYIENASKRKKWYIQLEHIHLYIQVNLSNFRSGPTLSQWDQLGSAFNESRAGGIELLWVVQVHTTHCRFWREQWPILLICFLVLSRESCVEIKCFNAISVGDGPWLYVL
jgi:hypothetical protein